MSSPLNKLVTFGDLINPGVLPIATSTSLGVVQVDGSTITITSGGIISAQVGNQFTLNTLSGNVFLAGTNNQIIITSSGQTLTLAVNVGTTANKIVQLDSSGNLPAINGSGITNLSSSNMLVGTVTLTDSVILSTDNSNIAFGKLQAQINQIETTTVSSKNTNYQLLISDNIIQATISGLIMTLPDATLSTPGRMYLITLLVSGLCTINTVLSQTINGLSTFPMTTQYATASFYSNGISWNVA